VPRRQLPTAVGAGLVTILANQSVDWIRKAEVELGTATGTLQPQPEIVVQVDTLRDIYEHWAEHVDSFRNNTTKSKAGDRFAKANPNLSWPGDGWKLSVTGGPHLDNLKLNDLFADLRRVEDLLLDAQRDLWASVGLTVPNGDYEPLAEWQYFVGAVQVDEDDVEPTV